MIPHIVFEALIKHYMYRTAPAKFRFITCPLDVHEPFRLLPFRAFLLHAGSAQ